MIPGRNVSNDGIETEVSIEAGNVTLTVHWRSPITRMRSCFLRTVAEAAATARAIATWLECYSPKA